jgi:uncharacterized membrane protein (UPF0127 family)
MRTLTAALLSLCLALVFIQAPAQNPPPDNPSRLHQLRTLERVNLFVGSQRIRTWIMDSESKRQEGMMFLTDKEVKNDDGMLFVFAQEQPLSFWMENTVLPLDLIFLDSQGRVINIRQGKPFDRSMLPSSRPAKYVLELRQGMAAKYGIKPGFRFAIPRSIRAKD